MRNLAQPTAPVAKVLREGDLVSGFRVISTPGHTLGHVSLLRVARSFCAECGTPISYEDGRLEGEIYIHVGVFDDPEPFEPEAHNWVSRKPVWLAIHDALPRYQESSIPR